MPRPIMLGIVGDSGSGKTTVTRGLVRVLPDWTLRGESIKIVYPGARYLPRRITAFVDAVDTGVRSGCPKPT